MSRGRFRRRKTHGRRSKKLPPKPLVLVVCEGTETEPLYFEALRCSKHIQKERLRVETGAACGGTDPSILVGTRKLQRKLQQEDGLVYDKVWCVFDRDDHPGFEEAVTAAGHGGIGLAYSIPCFELWYLLHFVDQTAHIERDRVVAELHKPGRLPGYMKSTPDVYGTLKSNQVEATRRAADLRAYHNHHRKPATTNPTTTVDELLKQLETL